ncbi:recombinase family protein [Albidovulum sediminis]|uniref:Recombinase family protein n=1 Tax=Albidovulum sediminis TaxID=3066345 RepID=A0ABT2NG79_9RHOB|nr:recombinase family protein [Defluviimonas sediminis]MCT8327921.1 recombinase family protein [Defluviimonas sediminis]
MKPCFGYIRVSTQKQGEGVSLEAQRDAITAFASRHNLSITEWFEEKETAAKSGRPVFSRMLKLLERGRARGLIIHKIDRSARNLKDWAIISDLSDAGIDVYFATESLDFRSRGGRLTADIQAVIAADYIRNLREETLKGMNGRLKQGLYPFRAPIGYRDNGRGKEKTICPVNGPQVRQVLELYASGAHSMRSLQAEAERLGLRSHTGRPLTLHGIEATLANPFYAGIIEIKRTGARFDGIHQPLITLSTFRRIQAIRSGRAGKKVTKHNHTYRGLIRCGHCDRVLSPELQKGHVYYRCHTIGCPTKTIREDWFDYFVQMRLADFEISEGDAERLVSDFKTWIGQRDLAAERQALDLQIGRATARMDRLTDLLVDSIIDADTYHQRKREMALEIAKLREDRTKLEENDRSTDDVNKFFELMKNLVQLHRLAKRDEKRQLVEICFSNRTLCEAKLDLEPYNWLQEIKNRLSVSNGDPQRDTFRTIADILKKFEHV